MSTLTDVVAAVVMHSSAVAFSHFGVGVEAVQVEKKQPAAERVVARTPRKGRMEKVSDCPDGRKLHRPAVVRA